MAFRTFWERNATDRPLSAIEMTKSESLSLSEAWIAWPWSVAGPSIVAAKVSPRAGSCTTPPAGRPSATSAIETQKNGMPLA